MICLLSPTVEAGLSSAWLSRVRGDDRAAVQHPLIWRPRRRRSSRPSPGYYVGRYCFRTILTIISQIGRMCRRRPRLIIRFAPGMYLRRDRASSGYFVQARPFAATASGCRMFPRRCHRGRRLARRQRSFGFDRLKFNVHLSRTSSVRESRRVFSTVEVFHVPVTTRPLAPTTVTLAVRITGCREPVSNISTDEVTDRKFGFSRTVSVAAKLRKSVASAAMFNAGVHRGVIGTLKRVCDRRKAVKGKYLLAVPVRCVLRKLQ